MGNVPVSSPGSLSCLPGPGSDLQRQHDQGDADHDDDEELGRPDLWCHVSVAHRGKGDDAEVEGLEEGELLTCSFQMLDAAGAAGESTGPSSTNLRRLPSLTGTHEPQSFISCPLSN